MDPISIIYLLISSGLLTQLLKYLMTLAKVAPDSKYTPMIAAMIGALNDALVVAPDGTISDAGANPAALLKVLFEGGAAGLSAVGGHQLLFSKNYIRKDDVTPSDVKAAANSGGLRIMFPYLLPILFALTMSGCAELAKSDAGKSFDFRVTTDNGCRSLVLLSTALGEKKNDVDALGQEGTRSYLTLQTLIQIMGTNCKS